MLGTVALALFSAVIFSLFWIGVASIVLGSTLFVTFGLAALGWMWFVGTYLAANFVYGLVAGSSDKADQQAATLKMEEKWASIDKKELGAGEGETSAVQHEDDGFDREKEIAKIYMEDMNDVRKACESFERAGEWYSQEDAQAYV